MIPVISAWFVLFSEEAIDLHTVTARTGITPTDVVVKGNQRFSTSGRPIGRPQTGSAWRLVVGPERTKDLNGLLERLLAPIEPAHDEVLRSIEDLALGVSAGLIGRIAALGAHLDLDLYVVEDDHDQPWGEE